MTCGTALVGLKVERGRKAIPGHFTFYKENGKVVRTHVPLSPSSVIWPKDRDVVLLKGSRRSG